VGKNQKIYMKQQIENSLLALLSARMARQANSMELIPKYRLHKHITLDASEIRAIDNIWKPISRKIDYRYWEVYKGMFKFSPFLMPDDVYVKSILRVINPMRKCYCLQNKNMYTILFRELKMPRTYVNCIDGTAFDSENNLIPTSKIITLLKKAVGKSKLILKPSVDSCSGNGVAILDLAEEENCITQLASAGTNWVIQELLSQSEKTKRYNPSSLNTFRINTLNLNGLITVENIMFRHGRGDSVVDNAGAGGICVGFNSDGNVVGKAIDANLNVYEKTVFGELYSSLQIPELQEISCNAISAHHHYLPMMGHVAWDFALDADDSPVFIEVNLGWPGIMTEQLSSCRPIFGNRTSEVIEFAIKNKSIMSFTDFIGHWT